jgi:transcription termination factor Rho
MREKLETRSLAELKEMAKNVGLKGISGLRKAELIDLLCAQEEKSQKNTAETVTVKPHSSRVNAEKTVREKPVQETRSQETRPQENRVQESRVQENRSQENRVQETRPQENRYQEKRSQDNRNNQRNNRTYERFNQTRPQIPGRNRNKQREKKHCLYRLKQRYPDLHINRYSQTFPAPCVPV